MKPANNSIKLIEFFKKNTSWNALTAISKKSGVSPSETQRYVYRYLSENILVREKEVRGLGGFCYVYKLDPNILDLSTETIAKKISEKKPESGKKLSETTVFFVNTAPKYGKAESKFLCAKELTPRIPIKQYVTPTHNPNYTPRKITFLTSGQGFYQKTVEK